MSQTVKKPKLFLQRKRKNAALSEFPLEPINERMNLNERESALNDDLSDNDKDVSDKRTEFYPVERYAVEMNGSEKYARNEFNYEFPLRQEGKDIYKKVKIIIDGSEHWVEEPALGKDDAPRYIHNNNGILYPMDLTINRPRFNLNDEGDEEYLTDQMVSTPHYPIDTKGRVHYARDAKGKEIPLEIDGEWIYAKGEDNIQVYPKTEEGDEFALLNTNTDPYYAKLANEDEYYPKKRVNQEE